jgi:hypothetical protein
MTKIFSTLMIGAALFGAAPALADNVFDGIQTGGGSNGIEVTQKGHNNSSSTSQEGYENFLKLKQRGRNNDGEAFQDGVYNDMDVDQRSRRRH